MPTKSLIEELPKIVREGKQEAQRIMERLSSSTRIGLQTNELVLPSKDTSGLWKGRNEQVINKEWMNRLIYGDNLLAMQALLAGDEATGLPSLRGKVGMMLPEIVHQKLLKIYYPSVRVRLEEMLWML